MARRRRRRSTNPDGDAMSEQQEDAGMDDSFAEQLVLNAKAVDIVGIGQNCGVAAPRPPEPVTLAPATPPSGTAEGSGRIFQKTKMCRFNILGGCYKGNQCPYAHSREELKPLPDLFRTKVCKQLVSSGRCDDPNCRFAHCKDQLRTCGTFRKKSSNNPRAAGGKLSTSHAADAKSDPKRRDMTGRLSDTTVAALMEMRRPQLGTSFSTRHQHAFDQGTFPRHVSAPAAPLIRVQAAQPSPNTPVDGINSFDMGCYGGLSEESDSELSIVENSPMGRQMTDSAVHFTGADANAQRSGMEAGAAASRDWQNAYFTSPSATAASGGVMPAQVASNGGYGNPIVSWAYPANGQMYRMPPLPASSRPGAAWQACSMVGAPTDPPQGERCSSGVGLSGQIGDGSTSTSPGTDVAEQTGFGIEGQKLSYCVAPLDDEDEPLSPCPFREQRPVSIPMSVTVKNTFIETGCAGDSCSPNAQVHCNAGLLFVSTPSHS